jgi:predicted DNA-binding transcriptional regulator AlpA
MAGGKRTAGDFNRQSGIEHVKPHAAKAEISVPKFDEVANRPRQEALGRGDRLLDRRAVEERTSLDITTIYRRIKIGAFPPPVRVARRRVAWRESDIAAWQGQLEIAGGRR